MSYPPPGGWPSQPPQMAPYPYQPPQPKRSWARRHPVATTLLSLAGAIFLLGGIGAAVGGNQSGSPSPTAAAASGGSGPRQTAPVSQARAHSTMPHLVTTFSGSGEENTPKFTVSDTWQLRWSYDCSSFGSQGNFAVSEDGAFGSVDVNELGMGGRGSTYGYGDGGSHYLDVSSECGWNVKIYDMP
jgi:hypothetical protein